MGAPCGLLSTEREKDRRGVANDEGSNRILAAAESQGISVSREQHAPCGGKVLRRSQSHTGKNDWAASAATSERGHGRFRVTAELVCFVTIYMGRRPVTPSELHFVLAF